MEHEMEMELVWSVLLCLVLLAVPVNLLIQLIYALMMIKELTVRVADKPQNRVARTLSPSSQQHPNLINLAALKARTQPTG